MSFAMVHDLGTIFSFRTKPGTAREFVCRLGQALAVDQTKPKQKE